MEKLDSKAESETQNEARKIAKELEDLKEFILKNDVLYQEAAQYTHGISVQEFQLLKIIHELDVKYMTEIQKLRDDIHSLNKSNR